MPSAYSQSNSDDSPNDTIPAGTIIDNYEIVEFISSGPLSEVYLAREISLNRLVVLKFLPPVSASDTESREVLLREAKAASRLNHPNIITIYGYAKFGSRDFIVMEYINGNSLRQLIQNGPIPFKDIIGLMLQIGDAIKSAHEAGIIHRDLKPENILIDENNRVRICDFGLAHFQDKGPLKEVGITSGSLAYMSPEQVQGDPLDHRTDLFSLGVILYELITGKVPFRGEYEAAIIFAIVNASPDSIVDIRPDTPKNLEEIVTRLLQKRKDERFQSAAELIDSLRGLTESGNLKSAPRRLSPTMKFLSLLALLSIFALLIYYTILRPKENELTLAILPFRNLAVQENEYITQGVTEAVTTALAKYGNLRVISSASARQYSDTNKPLRQIAGELGVDYLLVGSVIWENTNADSGLKINCQLINARNDICIWAQSYAPKFGQLIETQDEIAEKVVQDISGRLPRRNTSYDQLSANPRAYDYYLQGNYYLRRSWGAADYERAIQLYSSAIGIDSNFIMAYVMLSKVHSSMFTDRYDCSENRLRLSLNAANKALEIEPRSTGGRLALGMYYYTTRQFGLAMELFREVELLEPNNAELYGCIAAVQRRQGNFTEALDNFKHSSILEPTSPLRAFDVGMTYGLARNYSRAELFMNKAINLAPDWPLPYIYKAWIKLFWKGDKDQARLILAEASKKTDLSRTEYYRFYWWLSTILDQDTQVMSAKIIPVADTASYFLFKARIFEFSNEFILSQAYFDSARAYLEPIVAIEPLDPSYFSNLGIAYAGLGRDKEAVNAGMKATSMLPLSTDAYDGQFLVANLAEIYVMIGQYDAAIEQLDILLSRPGFTSAAYLTVDPLWSKLWDIPKFKKLIKRYK